jgi:hypothetical protein
MKYFLLILTLVAISLSIAALAIEINRHQKRKKLSRLKESWKDLFPGKPRVNKDKAREADIAYLSSWRLVYDERTGKYIKMRQVNVQKNRPR